MDLRALEEQALEALDRAAGAYISRGAGNDDTRRANLEAWRGLRLRPHVLRDVSAVDTAAAVLRRFPVEVHRVSFEKATWGLETDRHAGVADPGVGMVYLHPGYVLAEERERALYERRAELPPDPSLMVAEPYASVDETVAHELWHRIEAASHGPRAFGGVEFHRQVGEALGVDTLEHALRGGAPGAPEPWRVAHQRLVREVSAYAATDPREAKAEMFKRWWSHRDDPSPVVARFGELVESYFDAG